MTLRVTKICKPHESALVQHQRPKSFFYFIQFEDGDENYVALNWNKQAMAIGQRDFLVIFLTFTWFWIVKIRVALLSTKGND